MWRPGTPRSLRQESCEGDTRPAAIARRHGTKSSQGGGLELQSGYALPPFQATASRLTLIDAQSHLDCRADQADGRPAAPSQSIFTVLDETMPPVGHVLRASDHHRSRTASARAQPVADRGSLLAVPILVRLSLAIRKKKERSDGCQQNKRSHKGWRVRQGSGGFDKDAAAGACLLFGVYIRRLSAF